MDRFLARLIRRKPLIVVLLVLPGLWPAWPLFVTADPGVLADPAKYVLHHLGFTASVLLAVVLTFSPLRVAFPRVASTAALQVHRRLVGVSAFTYAALHLTMHFIYEGGFRTFATDWKKPFIAVGLVAFTILFALAVTSFNVVIRRLGAKRWKWLHRLVYVAALLVVYHQISAQKIFPLQVVWIFGPVLLLELWRVVCVLRQRRERSLAPRAGSAGPSKPLARTI